MADTSIFSSGIKPEGTATILAGRRNNDTIDRALLKFDLTSLPANAVLQSARLRLTVVKVPSGPANSNFSLHRMLTPWNLTASWNNAMSGTPWAQAGARAGVDYAAASSARQLIRNAAVYDFGPTNQLLADIEAWRSNPTANHGWLLKSESENVDKTARHFGSSESAAPPQLIIEYTVALPPPPPRLTDVRLRPPNLTFQFDRAPGSSYRVEFRDNVAQGSWGTLTNVPAASGPALITAPIASPQRFFRVAVQ